MPPRSARRAGRWSTIPNGGRRSLLRFPATRSTGGTVGESRGARGSFLRRQSCASEQQCQAPPNPPARSSIAGRRAEAKEPAGVAAAIRDLLGIRRTAPGMTIGALLDDPPSDPARKYPRGCCPTLPAPRGGEIRRSAVGAVDPSGAGQEPLHPVRPAPARHELLPLHLHPIEAPAERALPGRDRSLDRAH